MEQLLEVSKSCASDQVCYLSLSGQWLSELHIYTCLRFKDQVNYLYLGKDQVNYLLINVQ